MTILGLSSTSVLGGGGGGGGGGVFSLSRESYFSLQRTRVTIRGEIVTISDGYDRETKVIVHHYDVNIIKVFALRSFVTFMQLNQQHQYKYFAVFGCRLFSYTFLMYHNRFI